jgi:hypothetical protein
MMSGVLEAVHTLLFADAGIVAATGGRIAYARGPLGATFPQIHYFEVASSVGYLVDYNSVTIQVSAWALDPHTCRNIVDLVDGVFIRYTGLVGSIMINWVDQIDRSALPQADLQLYGQQARYTIRYKGANID